MTLISFMKPNIDCVINWLFFFQHWWRWAQDFNETSNPRWQPSEDKKTNKQKNYYYIVQFCHDVFFMDRVISSKLADYNDYTNIMILNNHQNHSKYWTRVYNKLTNLHSIIEKYLFMILAMNHTSITKRLWFHCYNLDCLKNE